ncbi:ABC transporter substrate-binding protein [Geobacter pickeringii]|uniref:ABC transporter substrate-binding protein n=1 Tax=Geobacter pickeringii TaxID=345632 RepID=A0A0B5BGJ6_9BACT|nr:ABC transporter substrate-binding protein [Geobacter pickeringii]AJE03635.1 ABC transporter substrate-binding protein [Geobacter pickeringii]
MTVTRYLAILILGIATLCSGSAAGAGKVVATVLTSDMPRYREAHRSFVKALSARGYDQGSVEILTQTPNPDPISWANTLRKFNAVKPDVIVTFGASATLAALQETDNAIPVVFADVYGPVETGMTRSMSKSGTNLCGASSKVPVATLVKTMADIRPVRTLGILYNNREAGAIVQLKELKRLAAQHGFTVVEANVPTAAGLDAALGHLVSRSDCLFVTESSVVGKQFDRIMRKANEARLPVISTVPEAAEKGALVTLEISPAEQGQLAAEYAAKILAGKKPGELPIATAHKVELVVNLHTAKGLGLQIPFRTLNAATKVLK